MEQHEGTVLFQGRLTGFEEMEDEDALSHGEAVDDSLSFLKDDANTSGSWVYRGSAPLKQACSNRELNFDEDFLRNVQWDENRFKKVCERGWSKETLKEMEGLKWNTDTQQEVRALTWEAQSALSIETLFKLSKIGFA